MFNLVTVENLKCPTEWRGKVWTKVRPVHGLPEGAAFIVQQATMEPVEVILRFLIFSVRKQSVALTTEIARAADLYEWLLYLDVIKRGLEDVEASDLEDYRDRLLTVPSLKTRQPLAPSTVRRRLSSIISFYVWANSEGIFLNRIQDKQGQVRLRRGNRGSQYARNTQAAPASALLPKVQATLPEFIDKEAVRRIFSDLGSDPLKPDGRPCRDWMISYLALLTGMRRTEIAKLTVHQVTHLRPTEESPARLRLIHTKGSKPRTVPIETFVHDRLMAYINGERQIVVAEANTRGKFRYRQPIALFLNGPHCATKYLGNPVTPNIIDRMFLKSQRRIFGIEPCHTFHHLRHTHVMQRRVGGDEWDNISRDLGHKQIMTTIDTYARALNSREPEARRKYVRALMLLTEIPT